MVRNGIPRVCFYFWSTDRNSELFPLLLKGLEGNSESLLIFPFHGTEFRVVFSSAEGFGREFRDFASIFGLRDGIPSCFLFRGRVRNRIPRISVPRKFPTLIEPMQGPLTCLGICPGSVYPSPCGYLSRGLGTLSRAWVPSQGLGIRVGTSVPAESPNNITLPMNILHIFIKPATEKEY